MILDTLPHAARYTDWHPLFAEAFAFLLRPDLATLPLERYPIRGAMLYASPQRGPGKRREAAAMEAHRQYIDIQYILSGVEEMGWRTTDTCRQIRTPYDPARDVEFYEDLPETWVRVATGAFTVFFPSDAHAPSVSDGEVHKIVLKLAV